MVSRSSARRTPPSCCSAGLLLRSCVPPPIFPEAVISKRSGPPYTSAELFCANEHTGSPFCKEEVYKRPTIAGALIGALNEL